MQYNLGCAIFFLFYVVANQINALLVQKRLLQNNKCIECQRHFRLCCFYFVVSALHSNLTNVSMLQYTFTLCLLRVKFKRLNYYIVPNVHLCRRLFLRTRLTYSICFQTVEHAVQMGVEHSIGSEVFDQDAWKPCLKVITAGIAGN